MNEATQEVLRALEDAHRRVVPGAARELALEDQLLDLGVASVGALEMAGFLEEAFDIRFPEHELGQLRTVGDFVTLIQRLRAANETPGERDAGP